jgi:hypothetical protein
MIALVAGGLIIALGAAAAGWFLFLRKPEPAVATIPAGTMAPAPAETAAPSGAAVAPAEPTPAPDLAPAQTGGAAPPNPPAGRTATPARPDASGGAAEPARPARTAPAEPAPRAESSSEYALLDEETPETDGREAGQRLAGTYRQGGGTSTGGTFGASGRFKARERSPRVLAPAERPAVATIRHLIDRMEAFHRKEGRYAGLVDLRASGLALDVPVSGNTFQRRGFRFEVTVESDGFRITATPLSPSGRSFVGDDSGYIRAGVD